MIYFNAMYSYVKLPEGTIYNWMVSSGFQHIQVSSFKRLIPPASMIDASHVRVKKKNTPFTVGREDVDVFFFPNHIKMFLFYICISIYICVQYVYNVYIYTHYCLSMSWWFSNYFRFDEVPFVWTRNSLKTSPNPKQVASFLISIHINPCLSWKISISNINDPYPYPHKSKCQSVSFLYPLVN